MDDVHRVNSVHGELPRERYETLALPTDAVSQGMPTATPTATSHGPGQRRETTAYSIDEVIADAVEQITGEPLPDPFTGDHTIEYWIWTGSRLVPATPEAAERLRQQEALEQEEYRLLRERQRALRQEHWPSSRRFVKRLESTLHHLIERWGLFGS